MSAADAAISVRGLIYDYPGVRALDDVAFDVKRGGVTALVGPNGAGKTTLMRCVAGLERPLAGEVRVAGIDVTAQPRQAHRRLGYLSDFFGLYDRLTVSQALLYAARSRGVAEEAAPGRVDAIVRLLDLQGLVGRLCRELSRGQRQRVAIAQSMVHEPEILLLDEPASGLDPEARHELAVLIRRMQAEGMTIVVSSHILAELDEYSTHMLVMRRGRVIDHRPLAHVAAAQARRFVATFAGPVAELPEFMDGVEVEALEGERAVLAIVGGVQTQADCVARLVELGLPLAAFHEERENLHDSYLKTVAREGGR